MVSVSLKPCAVWLLLCIWLAGCDSDNGDVDAPRLSGQTMGTTWSVVLAGSLPQVKLAAIDQAIQAELLRINRLMSTWDPTSNISRFNQVRSVDAHVLHPELLDIVDVALRVSVQSHGAYDITLAPVLALWGFGPASDASAQQSPPSRDALRKAMARAGYQKLVRSGDTLRKRIPDIELDLSSIAKGYAVDRIGELLEAADHENYLAEIGGEVRTRGRRLDQQPWQVGIEHPDGTASSGLLATDLHFASSGRYRNQRDVGGATVSHIIDGRTGKPVQHDLVAVTVAHTSVMLADAMATALLVLGETAAHQLAVDRHLAIRTVTWRDGVFNTRDSAAFSVLPKAH